MLSRLERIVNFAGSLSDLGNRGEADSQVLQALEIVISIKTRIQEVSGSSGRQKPPPW